MNSKMARSDVVTRKAKGRNDMTERGRVDESSSSLRSNPAPPIRLPLFDEPRLASTSREKAFDVNAGTSELDRHADVGGAAEEGALVFRSAVIRGVGDAEDVAAVKGVVDGGVEEYVSPVAQRPEVAKL